MTNNANKGPDTTLAEGDAPDPGFDQVEDVTLAASSDVVAQIRQQARQLRTAPSKSELDAATEGVVEACDAEPDLAIWTPDDEPADAADAADGGDGSSEEHDGEPAAISDAVVSIGDSAGEFASDSETVPASAQARARLAAAARALNPKKSSAASAAIISGADTGSDATSDVAHDNDHDDDRDDDQEDDDTNPRDEAVAAGALFDETTSISVSDNQSRAAATRSAIIAESGPADAGPMLGDEPTVAPSSNGAAPSAPAQDAAASIPAAQVLNEHTMPPSSAAHLAVPRVDASAPPEVKQVVVDDGTSLIGGMAPPAASANYWQGGANEQSGQDNEAFWSAGNRKRIPTWAWAVLAIALIIGASVLISLALT